MLAGTNGDGILRSRDGGKYWELSNFGLREFTVLSMAVAGAWERQEYAYAVTDGGIYQSPNGGRAWRHMGLADAQLQTVAVSHDFEEDGTVYTGGKSIFRSDNKGKDWQEFKLGKDVIVNTLCSTSDGVLIAGTIEHGIMRSKDGGVSWESVIADILPVFHLKEIGGKIYAGLYDQGALISNDGGDSWESLTGLAAKRFNRLAILPNGTMIAGGEELFVSSDNGKNWQSTAGLEPGEIISEMVVGGQYVYILTQERVLCSRDGKNWKNVFQLKEKPSALAVDGHNVWVGGLDGEIWRSDDAGETWKSLSTPFRSLPVKSLASKETVVLAVTSRHQAREVYLWRSVDGGQNWNIWHGERMDWVLPRLFIDGEKAEKTVFGIGKMYMIHREDEWISSQITTNNAPITAVYAFPDGKGWVAAITDKLVFSPDGEVWEPYEEGLEEMAIVDLQPGPDGSLLALTLGGGLWKRSI
jgi:photosystem II stability/assembly factor-like uncharacterized protein